MDHIVSEINAMLCYHCYVMLLVGHCDMVYILHRF